MMASYDWGTKEFLIDKGYSALESSTVIKPDFVVFPGGADVSPSLYFSEVGARTFCDKNKDMEEITNLAAARLYGIPQVGICRGIQFLHVMSGGTLTQHIEGHSGVQHNVIVKGGGVIQVTSSHHQCVAKDEHYMYEEVCFAEDGTVEAIFTPKHNWGAVQWHPEYKSAGPECQKFFIDMIEALTNKGTN